MRPSPHRLGGRSTAPRRAGAASEKGTSRRAVVSHSLSDSVAAPEAGHAGWSRYLRSPRAHQSSSASDSASRSARATSAASLAASADTSTGMARTGNGRSLPPRPWSGRGRPAQRAPRAPPGLPGRQTWPPETRTRQSVKTCLPRDQSGAVNPPCGARPAGQSKGALEHADRVRRELRRGDDGHFAEADESALPLRERLRVERRLLREGGRRRAGGQNLRPGRGHPPTSCQTRHWSP